MTVAAENYCCCRYSFVMLPLLMGPFEEPDVRFPFDYDYASYVPILL